MLLEQFLELMLFEATTDLKNPLTQARAQEIAIGLLKARISGQESDIMLLTTTMNKYHIDLTDTYWESVQKIVRASSNVDVLVLSMTKLKNANNPVAMEKYLNTEIIPKFSHLVGTPLIGATTEDRFENAYEKIFSEEQERKGKFNAVVMEVGKEISRVSDSLEKEGVAPTSTVLSIEQLTKSKSIGMA